MILESAQLLCTAHRELGNDNVPYKSTHKNHPSAVWTRSSARHYAWVYDHMMALGDEYERRYGRIHLTILKCEEHTKDLVVFRDPNKDLTYDDPELPTQTGEFGINIHRSNPQGTSRKVNKWSAGCQVFANSEDFKIFKGILQKSYEYKGISKREFRITYTLIEE